MQRAGTLKKHSQMSCGNYFTPKCVKLTNYVDVNGAERATQLYIAFTRCVNVTSPCHAYLLVAGPISFIATPILCLTTFRVPAALLNSNAPFVNKANIPT